MRKLAGLSAKKVRKAFERDGWEMVRRPRGSHFMMKKPGHRATLSIPDHKTIKIGLLRSLIRAAEMSVDDFLGYFEK